MKFHIITRCTRQQNLLKIKDSVFTSECDVTWHIMFDCSRLKDIDADILNKISTPNTKIYYVKSKPGDYLYPQSNDVIKGITDGLICFIDDDNILNPHYYTHILKSLTDQHKIYVVDQQVDGKDFTKLLTREAKPENTKYQGVDIGQLSFDRSVFDEFKFGPGYAADGYIVDEIMSKHPEWFTYINSTLSYYNYLVPKEKKGKVPKIILVSEKPADKLESNSWLGYEDTSLEVVWRPTDANITESINKFNPDAIVTIGDSFTNFPVMCNQPLQIRNKWITLPELNNWTGESAYFCAITNMLNNDNSKLISYFTPIYNTGEKLYKTFNSLVNQTYNNWEWVIVNDSTDGGTTLKIAEDIASKDVRVKVYDFREKSGGIIGESKYRAATLCKGFILAELDHDDLLTEDCTQMLWDASQKFPDAGFYYGDSVEINEKQESLIYGEGFSFGYGSYRKVKYNEHKWDVAVTSNINPKTIRHIVGVPNHIRAWRRDVYFAIGGHNRGLSVADDYELIVRTFLYTKMVKIPKLSYIQFIYNNNDGQNTHDLSRMDIQRRVRSIMYHYNDRIAKRFEELGVEDYAYRLNTTDPLSVESRFGNEENYVNYIYD